MTILMTRYVNLGNFFALARLQLDRANGEACSDRVLVDLLPEGFRPTEPSPTYKLMESVVPPDQRLLFAATSAYFGHADPSLLWLDLTTQEGRAKLVDDGGQTAPDDAPCRTWPWEAVEKRIAKIVDTVIHGRRLPQVYEIMQDVLGPYTTSFLADVRHLWPAADWCPINETEGRGLAWVVDDTLSEPAIDSAPLIVRKLLDDQAAYWPPYVIAPPWSVDAIVRWAGVCCRYVTERRK